ISFWPALVFAQRADHAIEPDAIDPLGPGGSALHMATRIGPTQAFRIDLAVGHFGLAGYVTVESTVTEGVARQPIENRGQRSQQNCVGSAPPGHKWVNVLLRDASRLGARV